MSLIFAALTTSSAGKADLAPPENGATVAAAAFRSTMARLSAISSDREFGITFSDVSMAAAPFLLWNLKRRGFSGCVAEAAAKGVFLKMRR